MNIKRSIETFKQLYQYGETVIEPECSFLTDRGLVYQYEGQWVVSRSWIEYGRRFPVADEFFNSLLLMEPAYQQYLLHHLLITAFKMRISENSAGIIELINRLPKLSRDVLKITVEIYGTDSPEFPIDILEEMVENQKDDFRELDLLIFHGPPNYQRLMYYLDKVQQFENVVEPPDKPLGVAIDEIWSNGRKISTLPHISPRQVKPLTVLAPFEFQSTILESNIKAVLFHPWRLFMLILGIIREQYAVENDSAISFRTVDEHVGVLLTSREGKEFMYGYLNSFAAYLSRALNLILFPQDIPDLEQELQWLMEYGIFMVRDGEYRLAEEIEDKLYMSSLGIPFITKSKELRASIERFIDELREKK